MWYKFNNEYFPSVDVSINKYYNRYSINFRFDRIARYENLISESKNTEELFKEIEQFKLKTKLTNILYGVENGIS